MKKRKVSSYVVRKMGAMKLGEMSKKLAEHVRHTVCSDCQEPSWICVGNEAYSTQMCPHCHKLVTTVGASKVFKCECGYIAPRDIKACDAALQTNIGLPTVPLGCNTCFLFFSVYATVFFHQICQGLTSLQLMTSWI